MRLYAGLWLAAACAYDQHKEVDARIRKALKKSLEPYPKGESKDGGSTRTGWLDAGDNGHPGLDARLRLPHRRCAGRGEQVRRLRETAQGLIRAAKLTRNTWASWEAVEAALGMLEGLL